MKIKTILLLLLFISYRSISQVVVFPSVSNLEKVNYREIRQEILNEKDVKQYLKGDTLYLYFTKNKNTSVSNHIYEKSSALHKKGDSLILYRYKLKDNSSIEFYYEEYFDFDLKDAGIYSSIIKERKNFLRKHKKEILTYKFFKKNRNKDVDYLLGMLAEIISSKKIIYIIDRMTFKGGMISIRQVMLNRYSHVFFIPKI